MSVIDKNVCEFCGQVLMDDQPCSCAQARQERELQDRLQSARSAAETYFADTVGTDVGAMLDLALKSLVYNYVKKVSVTFHGGVKANLTFKDGTVKIERSETIKDSMEV